MVPSAQPERLPEAVPHADSKKPQQLVIMRLSAAFKEASLHFFTADLHFGHANVIKFCARPFADVQEMDAALIANWNKRVGDDDDVWILGDFTFKRLEIAKNYLQQLQGRKHLIVGNHDYFARKHPDELSDVLVEITPYKELKLELNGHTAVLMHYPLLFWNGSMRVSNIMLFGHIHNNAYCEALTGKLWNALNVGVDVCGYRPISELEVLARIRAKNKLLKRSLNGPKPLTAA